MDEDEDENAKFYVECWDMVRLSTDEIDALCDAADAADHDAADAVVDGAYNRLFGESLN